MTKHKMNKKPFVSVVTPTFNRRPFINAAIQCFLGQDYPRNLMEWIIVDDGTDKIEDLVKDVPGVRYFKYDEKMPLGKKRNVAHEKCSGEIIVYMDDDDYYPKTRVSHAISVLRGNPKALCAGSSEMHIYFSNLKKLYKFGPYNPNHATAGTFAFRRELLSKTRYDDTAALAEEKSFLKDYTIPFVQLDAEKTILVFNHKHSTFDKQQLLSTNNPYVAESLKTLDSFGLPPDLKTFYCDTVSKLLDEYEPGSPSHKPDVVAQIEARKDAANEKRLNQMIQEVIKENQELKKKVDELNQMNEYYKNKLKEYY
jgi:glycosyltransferase involved in cell wall biosynthesis